LETPNIRTLIKAGFHFGHRTSRWNPKMEPFIFKRRNLIHIIDLRETLRGLILGRKLASAVAARGQDVLFVGTKKQAQEAVEREATRCGMPYVAQRWPGGMLTNYVTIRTRLDRLTELEEMEKSGQIQLYSKKMVSTLRREKRKILRNLGGVRNMQRVPGLLVVIDPAEEHIALREAQKLGVPVVALTDTDGNPDQVDVVVPGNDDSIGAIEIFLATMADAVLASRASHRPSAAAPREAEEDVAAQFEMPEQPAEEAPAAAEPAAGEAPAQESESAAEQVAEQ
jgi:small subunit ribosomal protein S2